MASLAESVLRPPTGAPLMNEAMPDTCHSPSAIRATGFFQGDAGSE